MCSGVMDCRRFLWLLAGLFLLTTSLYADVDVFTFPGGATGEVQYNDRGIFDGTPYMVVSTTTGKLQIFTPTVGSPSDFATYCSSASHIGRLLISSGSTSGQWVYVCESSGNWVQQGGSGGGGSPGGSDTQLQYNNAGSFGGIASATFSATTNVLTVGATTIFSSVSTTTWANVSTVTFSDGVLINMSDINMSANTEGFRIPQTTDCSNANTEGQICWDTDDDLLYVGGSAPTMQFPNRGTLTSGTTLYPSFLYVGSSASVNGQLSVNSLKLPDGSETIPTIVRSAASTTGIGFSASGIHMIGTGTNAASFNPTGSEINSSGGSGLRVNTLPNSGDGTLSSIFSSVVPQTINRPYAGNLITHQNLSGQIRGVTYGLRDDVGEDPYFFVNSYDATSGTRVSTGLVHINISSHSVTRGNFGINVSTPLAKLSVGGHVQIATNTATNPTVSSCGTGPSVVGHDGVGTITVGTGGADTSCTLTFGTAWTNPPTCSVWHEGAILYVRPVTTTTTLTITSATPMTAGGTIKYSCVGWE